MRIKEKDDENDKKFALALKEIECEVLETLNEVSSLKSKRFGISLDYKPGRMLHCRLNNFCNNTCENKMLCRYYIQVRNFFLRFGFLIYPYTLYRNRLPVQVDKSMGFHDARARNVLFISTTCSDDDFRDDPINSALNISFHEFLNAMSKRISVEYELLLFSINSDDLKSFFVKSDSLNKLLRIYGKRELIPVNEVMHRYITNNPDTKYLLVALFTGDKHFRPPDIFQNLYKQLKELFDKLENP